MTTEDLRIILAIGLAVVVLMTAIVLFLIARWKCSCVECRAIRSLKRHRKAAEALLRDQVQLQRDEIRRVMRERDRR